MLRGLVLAAVVAITLSGCDRIYESRIRGALMDAGLSRGVAGCMAERMVDRLSAEQLKSLTQLGDQRDGDTGDMNVSRFLSRYGARLDPKVYEVMVRAGIGCALTA